MLVFIRHAKPRRSEHDPGLTSAGVRMAREAAGWVAQQLTPLAPSGPVRVLHTPTQRTRQTAEAVQEWLGDRARLEEVDSLPETVSELDLLAARLSGSLDGLPPRPLPATVLVGHHTTVVGLSRELAPQTPAHLLPSTINFAVGIALHADKGTWGIRALWPGRIT